MSARLNQSRGQTLSFIATYSSPLVQATQDGPESSPPSLGDPQLSASSKNLTPRLLSKRLNPYFVEWLMGWPAGWTSAIAQQDSRPVETELFRSALQQHLSCLLGEPGNFRKQS